MSRLALLCVSCVVLVAACRADGTSLDPGPDSGSGPDGGTLVLPDGNVVPVPDAGGADDAGVPAPDGMVALTECEEATQHSDLAWLQDHVFTPSCASATCHDAVDPDVDLSLAPGMTHANLVNRNTSTLTGWRRVVPGSPTTSYLVVALGRAPGPAPRDGFMPLNAEPLCVEKLEAIERWIAAGALP